jgi:uncharacterized protein (TIGR03067 family)
MRYALLTLAGLSLAFAPAPFPKPNKGPTPRGDLKALQGDWLQVNPPGGVMGRPAADLVLRVAGDRFTFMRAGRAVSEWTGHLDTSKKPPTLDLRNAKGAPAATGVTVLGVYALAGDSLQFAYRIGSGGQRPLAVQAGPGVQMMAFTRAKK